MTHALQIIVLRREVIQENWVIEVEDENYPADLDYALLLLDSPQDYTLIHVNDALTYSTNNREVIDMKAICS